MKITKHAIIRSKQRGIKTDLVDLVLREGKKRRLPGGAVGYFLSKQDKARLLSEYKKQIQTLDHTSGVEVVESSEGAILTVYHR